MKTWQLFPVSSIVVSQCRTDGCSGSATIAAIAGRAIHAYHAEGAAGGPYDLLEIVSQPNVIPCSTNPTIP